MYHNDKKVRQLTTTTTKNLKVYVLNKVSNKQKQN